MMSALQIPVSGDAVLDGDLTLAPDASPVVVFAHGSGSSRLSPRNRTVADYLNQQGFSTLLFDLLTDDEATDRHNVFDIPLLADRLSLACDVLRDRSDTADARLGVFGASTGAAAALRAAALRRDISAVVSRGGRPDLAADCLPRVEAPTLLIIGGNDHTVIELNELASNRLTCPHETAVIPGAGHLFEEPGTLGEVARLAAAWFTRWLVIAP